jgi:hypothetical protein
MARVEIHAGPFLIKGIDMDDKRIQVAGPALRISLAGQQIGKVVQEYLDAIAGQETAYVLLISADQTVQYLANVDRRTGMHMVASQLEHWKKAGADIPAHLNVDELNPSLRRTEDAASLRALAEGIEDGRADSIRALLTMVAERLENGTYLESSNPNRG